MKKALITGITGQDGSYLAEFLLDKGYEVHGIKRRSSSFNTQKIDHIYESPHKSGRRLILHYGDLTDSISLTKTIEKIQPDEIYNLGAQSHVGVSFDAPIYTADVVALGSLRILESIRLIGLQKKSKFYQASSSELFGKVQEIPQNETTPFYPRSPYAVSKLFSYWATINYREAYDLFACNGILFNHESPRRGETFVTRKITRSLSRISLGLENCLYLGNLDSLRDWGHAKDFVEMQWLILQQEKPKDYVISTGKQFSVRYFVDIAAKELNITLNWIGKGLKEQGVIASVKGQASKNLKVGDVIVKVDPKYFRPAEVNTLLGDSNKAKKELNWQPKIKFEDMVNEMVFSDLKDAQKEKLLVDHNLLN